ncbi:hypothetical protein B0A49_01258 [Cryomyces minteri]|uniref:DUF1772 domain-containing protein n=1 Tax=Cryomyces minteri TaxID=331657 RepID=A0A4U0XV41_9PEZI|nr:hypothetical protein B0A49_01258 [Cryomyces minteri]
MATSTGLFGHRSAQLLSMTSCALFFGSTTWASVAVMPSLIAAPISTYAKLAVFKGLILRANAILPPVFGVTLSSLAYLALYSPLPESRRNYLVAVGALLTSFGLQIPVLPRNKAMVKVVDEGRGQNDDGREGNERIRELLMLNWGRVVLGGVAFGIGLLEIASS